jgi:predicted ABC-type ATPase
VPEQVVCRRFSKSISNFLYLYRPLADCWVIFENSTETPAMVASEEFSQIKINNKSLFDKITQQLQKS